MSGKPRVLFLAFCFPPMHAVASIRAAKVAKYLSQARWDVSVVTPAPDLLQSPDDLEQAAADIRRWGVRMIYTGHRWRCLSAGTLKRSYRRGIHWLLEGVPRWFARKLRIDEMAGWYSEAERACEKLQPGDVDVILATGGPFGAFGVAQRLSRRLQCPYVLDYRDPWTGNPHASFADKDCDCRVERRLLEDCAAVSIVSPAWARDLGDRFGATNKIHVITNGYDPADFECVEPMSFEHFAIVYTGLFLPPKRDVGPLLQALSRLAELKPARPWKFHYFGPHERHVREGAKACGIENRIELHGTVSRRQSLAAIRGAGAAVVITSIADADSIADRGIIPGKIFEPIGMGTPVMVIAPSGSDVERVIETAGKGAVFVGSNIEGMARFFAELMQGQIPESRRPDAYAWPHLIQEFDVLLRQVKNG